MKKTFYSLTGIVLSLCLCFSAKAKNFDGTTCFTDGFGYVWTLNYTGDQSGNVTATGTVDIGGGQIWNAVGEAYGKGGTGTVHLNAINPSPDGCNSFTDSFVYVGTATIDRTTQHYTDYGSGTWESYCGCSVLNSGTWDATGPCGASLKITNPNGPAVHSQESIALRKALGKTCFTDAFGYVWEVHYVPQCNHLYYIQGKVDIGQSIRWDVSGYATINQLSGPIELHAVNPHPDGCTRNSDSFVYVGTISIAKSAGSYSSSGTGTWESYCAGSAINGGTWDATGPCNATLQHKVDPNGPAAHVADAFRFKVSPNPLKSSSVITYNLAKESKVSITVYNYMQQPVKQIINRTESVGKHSYVIDGASLSNGVYRVIANVDGKSYTTSLQVIK